MLPTNFVIQSQWWGRMVSLAGMVNFEPLRGIMKLVMRNVLAFPPLFKELMSLLLCLSNSILAVVWHLVCLDTRERGHIMVYCLIFLSEHQLIICWKSSAQNALFQYECLDGKRTSTGNIGQYRRMHGRWYQRGWRHIHNNYGGDEVGFKPKHLAESEFFNHCLVCFNLDFQADKLRRNILTYNKGNFNKICTYINQYSTVFFSKNPSQFSADEKWLQLKSHPHNSINSNIPSKLSTSSKARPPWPSSKVHNLIICRDRLAKIASISGSMVDRCCYRKARNDCSQLIDSTHNYHLIKLIGNVKSDPRALYRYINSKKSDTSTILAFK